MKVAVIGAGIIGVCTAEALLRKGAEVTLIDKDEPGEGCSAGNAGHFANEVVLPLSNVKTLIKSPLWLLNPNAPLSIRPQFLFSLAPWLLRFAAQTLPRAQQRSINGLKRLNLRSVEFYRALLKRYGLQKFMVENGYLTIYKNPRSHSAIVRHMQKVSSHGVPVEYLSPMQVSDKEPILANRVAGALYYPNAAYCPDPKGLVKTLAAACFNLGGRFLQKAVTSIATTKRGVKVFLGDDAKQFDKLVVCAGIQSDKLLKPLGYRLPLEAERGYHLQLSCSPPLRHPLNLFEESFVMTPMHQGLRLAGTVELASRDAKPNYERAYRLLNLAKRYLPELSSDNSTVWMGCRPSFPDSLPVISQCPNHPPIFAAFGHQHLGLTQGAITGAWTADLVMGETKEDLSLYRIDRF